MKKGFTLIELLGVIVILSIIALISVPLVLNTIEKAQKNAFKDSGYGILKSAELVYALEYTEGNKENITFNITDRVVTSVPANKALNFKGSIPKEGRIIVENGNVSMAIWDGKYCVTKDKNFADLTIEEKDYDDCKVPNEPELMIGLYTESEITDLIDNQGYIPITTPAELNNIRTAGSFTFGTGSTYQDTYTSTGLTNNYILLNDIDLNVAPYNSGSGFVPIGNLTTSFQGTFNGNAFTINNLFINNPTLSYSGLFGVTTNSTIENLKLTNANVTGSNYTGSLVGSNNGIINNCSVSGTVTGGSGVGGFAGYNQETILNVYYEGIVTGDNYVSGLIGQNIDTVENSYSVSSIIGNTNLNGLLYSSGIVSSSFWNSDLYSTSQSGSGKTTIQMKQQATYLGWDFTNTWIIDEGNDYPRLIWE